MAMIFEVSAAGVTKGLLSNTQQKESERILLPYVAEWMRENPRVEHVLTKFEWREYHKHRSCTLDQHRACRFLNLVIGAAKESLKKKSKGKKA